MFASAYKQHKYRKYEEASKHDCYLFNVIKNIVNKNVIYTTKLNAIIM